MRNDLIILNYVVLCCLKEDNGILGIKMISFILGLERYGCLKNCLLLPYSRGVFNLGSLITCNRCHLTEPAIGQVYC
jgi:hypothetical protein